MVNTAKLKERMVELEITQKAIAEELSISAPAISHKVNNIRPMLLNEADLLADILHINNEEFSDFFLL